MARRDARRYMMVKLLSVLLLAAALAASASSEAAEGPLEVVSEGGQPVAQFSIGDSHCELTDHQVRCTRVER
jgi:hypothetical protein